MTITSEKLIVRNKIPFIPTYLANIRPQIYLVTDVYDTKLCQNLEVIQENGEVVIANIPWSLLTPERLREIADILQSFIEREVL